VRRAFAELGDTVPEDVRTPVVGGREYAPSPPNFPGFLSLCSSPVFASVRSRWGQNRGQGAKHTISDLQERIRPPGRSRVQIPDGERSKKMRRKAKRYNLCCCGERRGPPHRLLESYPGLSARSTCVRPRVGVGSMGRLAGAASSTRLVTPHNRTGVRDPSRPARPSGGTQRKGAAP
jgi:hypothetical protein